MSWGVPLHWPSLSPRLLHDVVCNPPVLITGDIGDGLWGDIYPLHSVSSGATVVFSPAAVYHAPLSACKGFTG